MAIDRRVFLRSSGVAACGALVPRFCSLRDKPYNGGKSEAVGSVSPASRQVCVAPDNLTFFAPSIWPLGFRDARPGICPEGTGW